MNIFYDITDLSVDADTAVTAIPAKGGGGEYLKASGYK